MVVERSDWPRKPLKQHLDWQSLRALQAQPWQAPHFARISPAPLFLLIRNVTCGAGARAQHYKEEASRARARFDTQASLLAPGKERRPLTVSNESAEPDHRLEARRVAEEGRCERVEAAGRARAEVEAARQQRVDTRAGARLASVATHAAQARERARPTSAAPPPETKEPCRRRLRLEELAAEAARKRQGARSELPPWAPATVDLIRADVGARRLPPANRASTPYSHVHAGPQWLWSEVAR